MNSGLLFLLMMYFSACPTDDMLTKHRWKDRVILIFSPSEQTRLYQDQIKLFSSESEGLKDRDLVLYELFPDSGRYEKSSSLSKNSVNRLRKRFSISPEEVTVILIGKDGGEKARKRNEIFPIQELFALIDGMPMRRQEIRRKQKSSSGQ
ncbi:MAG: DUF4174 domain-containing protein [Bacteroidota bacterium]